MHPREEQNTLHVGLVGPMPPPFGGMANQTRQLQALLESEGIRVSLVRTNAAYRPKTIARIRGARAFFRIIPYLLKLWAITGRVDIVHIMANSGWSWQLFATPAVWIGWLRGKPVVINYRGGEARKYLRKSINRVRPTIARANVVVVPSEYLKTVFREFGLDAQIVSNIIDLTRFKPRNRGTPSPSTSTHLVVTRNLEPIYDIPTALHCVSILRSSVPNIRLSIAGSGPQRAELQNLVTQLKIADIVDFTGKLCPDEMAALYQSADIMLNPTTVDNMPNSVLEALACGVAVVTTNVGGIPYIVEDGKTALLVDPGDPAAMAEQVKRLLEDPSLYMTLVSNGLAEVKQYAWTAVRNEWVSIYEKFRVTQ
jgi:glycosyltransferase involved in cell wall biosynthesis